MCTIPAKIISFLKTEIVTIRYSRTLLKAQMELKFPIAFPTGCPAECAGNSKFDFVPGAVGGANQRNRIAFRIGCRLLFHFSPLGLLDQSRPDGLFRRFRRRPRSIISTTFYLIQFQILNWKNQLILI